MLSKKIRKTIYCNSQKDASDMFHSMVYDKDREHFISVNMDARNKAKSVNIISIGTLNANLVHPREVFISAIKEKAAKIIVCHNHPSGSLEPSEADLELTKRLKDCGVLLGIEVMDHVIIDGRGRYKSIEQ